MADVQKDDNKDVPEVGTENQKKKGKKGAKKKEEKKAKPAKDRASLELRDKAGKKFWRKNFKDEETKQAPEIITKDLFYEKCLLHVRSNRLHILGKIGEEKQREEFVRLCVDKFFLIPFPDKYPDQKSEIAKYVDKESVQFCCNVFGPWIQLFTMFFDHFCNATQEVKPLDIFWGFVDDAKVKEMLVKKNEGKSSKKMRYLMRYRIHPETKTCDLVISSIRRGRKKKIMYQDEPLIRKKFTQRKPKPDDDKPIKENKPKWTYTERVASVGRYDNQTTAFTTLENLLEYLRGNYQEDTKSRISAKIKYPLFTEEYKKEKKVDDTAESSEPKTPEEREPMKITPMEDEEETDEETLKKLEEEEKKLQEEYENN